MNDRAAWLEKRRAGIGASDIAAILGISPWTTPLQLYLDKRGEAPPKEDEPQMRRGRMLEPIIVDMYTDETGHAVTRQQEHVIGAEPWMMATLDGFDADLNSPVEVKSVNAFAADGFGEAGTDEVPLYYAAQVQWQMMLTDSGIGYLAALIGSDDFRIFRLERDKELETMLAARAAEFWKRVTDGNAPEPTCELDVKLLYPRDTGISIDAGHDVMAWCSDLAIAKAAAKQATNEVEILTTKIKTVMGGASSLLGPNGKPIATWKNNEAGSSTDWEGIATELGAGAELIAKYTKPKDGARPFLLKL